MRQFAKYLGLMMVYMKHLYEFTQHIQHTAQLNYKLLGGLFMFIHLQVEIQHKDFQVETICQIIKTSATIIEIKLLYTYLS